MSADIGQRYRNTACLCGMEETFYTPLARETALATLLSAFSPEGILLGGAVPRSFLSALFIARMKAFRAVGSGFDEAGFPLLPKPADILSSLERTGARALLLACPSLFGDIPDTEEIAAVCREKDARLILDLTEDPRLPFAEETARAAFGAADILLFHLPDAGGTVAAARSCADTDILSRSLWLSGGSCPEKTAEDIDYAVYRLQRESVSETLDGIGKWRERIAALPGLSVKAEGGDPFAVTVLTGDRGLRGPGAAAHLALAGVAVDCAYGGVTIHFDPAREDLFQKAYEAFRTLPYGKGALKPLPSFVLAAPAAVEPALAAAYHDTVPCGRAAGKVSACFLPCTACSCPVVLPGERIGEGAARFLNAAGETDLIEVIPDA